MPKPNDSWAPWEPPREPLPPLPGLTPPARWPEPTDPPAVASVEIVTHEQLKDAALVILHARDNASPDECVNIARFVGEFITRDGYEAKVVVSNALKYIEVQS